MREVRHLTIAWAFLGPLLIGGFAGGAEPVVIVRLASGRQFQGEVDASSTMHALVLRTASGGITLRRPIAWERIVSVDVDGQRVEVSAVREGVEARSGERGARNAERGKSDAERMQGRTIEMRGEALPAGAVDESRLLVENVPPRVATITFDAQVANWDADVETDGVVITVAPVDWNGYAIAANGTLEVELFVPQRRQFDLAPLSGGDTLELVERWTRSIAAEDFGPSGVRLRLPFGAITPELQPDWTAWWYGLVHVRLAIPGQGVFEDSRDGIRVRPWAPNRDRLEMKTGVRFLPTENLGRRE